MQKWIIPLLIFSVLFSSCMFYGDKRIKGNGHLITETRSFGSFENIEASGNVDVIITQGAPSAFSIEGDENILPYITFHQIGNSLQIGTKNGYSIKSSHPVKLYITQPKISSIEVSGVCSVLSQGQFVSSSSFSLSTSGVAKIDMDLNVKELNADISGSGNLSLRGQAQDVTIDISGVGSAHCFGLQTQTAKVDISGMGSAELFVLKNLQADISGAGNVHYKGNPTIAQDVSGTGSVTQIK